MNWWYKDVFIERTVVSELEHHPVSSSIRARMVKKSLLKLKQTIIELVRIYKQKRKMKQSYHVLNQLSEHHLADVGLSKDQVYWMLRGKKWVRYQENATRPKQKFELISNQHHRDSKVTERTPTVDYFDKAA